MSNGSTNGLLAGKTVAATGTLASMTHAELAELVAECGGGFIALPNRHTSILVIGQEGWPLQEDGRQTVCLRRARRLRAVGYALELVTEEDFLGRLGLTDRQAMVHRRCTIAQLARLLRVPGRRLRAWIRVGLVEPVEIVHRLAYFDFREVASARNLCELTASGVTPQRIRDSLEQLHGWLPGVSTPLNQLTVLQENGRLLVRLDDDKLAEPSGQLQFDFLAEPEGRYVAEPEDRYRVVPMSTITADEWFDRAIAHEDRGENQEAVFAYREAIRLEPGDATLHFNLGNALFTLGRPDEAGEAFRQAVDIDPAYVEAWNNLGNVLADQQRPDEAARAYERAIQLLPTYADAHYNLGELLSRQGRQEEARQHWRIYLQSEPAGQLSDQLRTRLAAAFLTTEEK